jgi:hypothetical protein
MSDNISTCLCAVIKIFNVYGTYWPLLDSNESHVTKNMLCMKYNFTILNF